MRPIEFRVWDKLRNRYVNGDRYGDLALDLQNGNVLYGDLGCEDGICVVTEQVIIEQCTGLRDKNGIKIFEGDIVRIDNLEIFELTSNYNDKLAKGSCISDVKIIDGHTYVWLAPVIDGKTIKYGAQYLKQGLAKHIKKSAVATDNVEIIGTIHENKELLEVAE
ncbi:YopX family protein [Listeria sp. SHR_NRA_18]|uniref:YopX family protein n=1 Tax=Listeria sp. SHR_NRA_18 TaxID=2269046 RepID=UPI001374AB8C|nr:YopX family protein [Listeria sp. SHR_NRA_18]